MFGLMLGVILATI